MIRVYIDGASRSYNNKSSLTFAITDLKGNLEYQFYELLDTKRNHKEILMMAFAKMVEWLLENKFKKIIVYTDSTHVYMNWKKNKIYKLNKNKFDLFIVRLVSSPGNVINLSYA